MKWEMTEPAAGAMIRVKVGPFYHYGIYVSDDEIIQFGPNPTLRLGIPDSQLCVCTTDINQFLCGEFLEVAVPERNDKKKIRKPEVVLAEAKKRLGETGYHILYNNCEHFAYQCLTGEHYCAQTDNVRAMFRSLNIVDLYTAAIGDGEIGPVVPQLRQELLDATTHTGLQRQRYYVWKLLEYGINRSLGLKMENLHFSRDSQGKWHCEECYFSLSHCEDAVAVAVSKKPIGVDLECIDRPISPKLIDKILTPDERQQAENIQEEALPQFLLTKWCAKESLYKAGSNPSFRPKELATHTGVITKTLEIGGKNYCCAVASADCDKLRIYSDIKL